MSVLDGDAARVRFDLALNVHEREGEYRLSSMAYAADILDSETVRRMLDHYAHVLDQATRDAGQRLASPGLGAPGTVPTGYRRCRLPCARRIRPGKPRSSPGAGAALRSGNPELRGTGYLVGQDRGAPAGLGASADDRIGLCAARSAALIPGVVGILKSGAAFVPLDPAIRRSSSRPWWTARASTSW